MKKITNIALMILTAAAGTGLLPGCKGAASSLDPRTGEDVSLKRVAAYIRTTWSIPERLPGYTNWAASQIKGQYLTDLMLAFAVINEKDKTTFSFIDGTDYSYLWNEIAALKTAYPHLRINLSVGGWGADHFSDMAHDPAVRAGFVTNAVQFLKDKDLDGIDIDWEYPVGPSWGQQIKSRPEDRANWVSLLRDLRNALDNLSGETGKRYYLSACVPASSWFLTRNDCAAAAEYVDSLKLMAYDYYGAWTATTGHHANLYRNPIDPGGWSTGQSVDAYLKAGVPPEKLMLGLPTYGKEWIDVTGGLDPKLPGLFSSNFAKDSPGRDIDYHYTIKEYLADKDWTRYWDNAAQAAFLYNRSIGGWVSYMDGEQIKLISAYAKSKGLGGLFYWEYAWDMEAELLEIMHRNAMGN
ncbi:MAG: glycoside hydrolase family 18 protein [Treponema sp.]|jgi:chitinase|nr:glycoside hydrolase family 18 protein [Treponema sp.]